MDQLLLNDDYVHRIMEVEIALEPPSSEIVTSRNVLASVEAVFTAWSDPAYLAKWWGPRRFSNTFIEFDFREGGNWRYIMHGPSKYNYPCECQFKAIVPVRLIAWNQPSDPPFTAAVSFQKITKRITNITFTMCFNDADECARVRKYTRFRTEQAFDKLEKELEIMEPQSGDFKMPR